MGKPLALAVISAGPDAAVHHALEMVLGETNWQFRFASVKGDYRELIEAVDNGLLAECRDAELGPYAQSIKDAIYLTDPQLILCYDPWKGAAMHLQEDFGIEHAHYIDRLVDIRPWGYPDHMGGLKDLAAKYGISWNPTGRAQDEADVIVRIAETRGAV